MRVDVHKRKISTSSCQLLLLLNSGINRFNFQQQTAEHDSLSEFNFALIFCRKARTLTLNIFLIFEIFDFL